ncbi:helix-turn-helix domain-containing protein [Nonomuraea sp. NPDC051191]|uniref:helix-turn-helix domain-containing protein n=1 Tax=Nonomuraea sp. NPDC051191 TaxID=3364372 RepID=UPI00378896A5
MAVDILGRRLGDHPRVDLQVARAWRRTLSTRGRVRVDGLPDEVGWSRKRLWSRFRSQLGITPGRAARLVRFHHAAHLLAAGHAASRVAAENGYVDQSHLHREVATFAGLTPTALAVAPWLAVDDVAWPASSLAGVQAADVTQGDLRLPRAIRALAQDTACGPTPYGALTPTSVEWIRPGPPSGRLDRQAHRDAHKSRGIAESWPRPRPGPSRTR